MGPRAGTLSALAAVVVAAAGCGGGERQDADDPVAGYELEITGARFPERQSLAERETMAIEVRNADSKAVPNVAVTVETGTPGGGGGGATPRAFGTTSEDPALADAGRPVWVVDRAPRSGDTAYTNTWALGRLEPGRTARFEWRVTPVTPGEYTVAYRVSPSLAGTSARLAPGGRTDGEFRVTIGDEPRQGRISDDGEIIVE